MQKKNTLAWFLFGLGSQLQIIASLSFTELFVFVAAPFIFLREKDYMRRNGVMPFFWFSMLVMIGCAVACIANHTAPLFVLRGMAVTCLLPCTVVVGHWMLRRDMGGFKWMLIGTAISSVLCTFVFQKSVELTMHARGMAGSDAATAIMAGPIYWINRLGVMLNAIPKGWYLQCPTFVSIGIPLFMAGFSMLTSVSGRSAALCAIGSAALIFIGGKKRETIKRRFCNKFGLWCCVAIIGIFCMYTLYRVAATQGWLSDEALDKYEYQTAGKSGIMSLVMGGRGDSFIGLLACRDKPIVGWGPWAEDVGWRYRDEFLSKYGNENDYRILLRVMNENYYDSGKRNLISAHAYITEFWVWCGIFGLLFWLYVIFVLIRYLRQDSWVVPQWFMWIASAIPGYFWGIFFSPWTDRIGGIVFIVACLMARAVRLGAQPLPDYMEEEIMKVESK